MSKYVKKCNLVGECGDKVVSKVYGYAVCSFEGCCKFQIYTTVDETRKRIR